MNDVGPATPGEPGAGGERRGPRRGRRRTETTPYFRDGERLTRAQLLRLRVELDLFESYMGADRVVEAGRCYHRWCDEEFPCAVDPAHAEDDWAWAAGYGGPRYSYESSEMAVVEIVLGGWGIGDLYVRVLRSLVDPAAEDGDELTPEALFRLVSAPAELRAPAASAAMQLAKEQGRI